MILGTILGSFPAPESALGLLLRGTRSSAQMGQSIPLRGGRAAYHDRAVRDRQLHAHIWDFPPLFLGPETRAGKMKVRTISTLWLLFFAASLAAQDTAECVLFPTGGILRAESLHEDLGEFD